MTGADVLWFGTSLIGALAALLGSYEAQRDRRSLRALSPRNGRHLIADQQLFRQLLRLGIFVAWTIAPFTGLDLLVALLIGANVALLLATMSDLYVGAILRRAYAGRNLTDGE